MERPALNLSFRREGRAGSLGEGVWPDRGGCLLRGMSLASLISCCVARESCTYVSTNAKQYELATHVDILVLVQARQALKRRLDVLRGYVADLLGLQDAHEPPVAVAIVHEEKAVTFDDVCLTLYCCDEGLNGVDQVKVDGFGGDGQ